MGAPLRIEGYTVGTLCATFAAPPEEPDAVSEETLQEEKALLNLKAELLADILSRALEPAVDEQDLRRPAVEAPDPRRAAAAVDAPRGTGGGTAAAAPDTAMPGLRLMELSKESGLKPLLTIAFVLYATHKRMERATGTIYLFCNDVSGQADGELRG